MKKFLVLLSMVIGVALGCAKEQPTVEPGYETVRSGFYIGDAVVTDGADEVLYEGRWGAVVVTTYSSVDLSGLLGVATTDRVIFNYDFEAPAYFPPEDNEGWWEVYYREWASGEWDGEDKLNFWIHRETYFGKLEPIFTDYHYSVTNFHYVERSESEGHDIEVGLERFNEEHFKQMQKVRE